MDEETQPPDDDQQPGDQPETPEPETPAVTATRGPTFTELLPCPLPDGQIAEKGRRLASLMQEHDLLEDDRKASNETFKGRIAKIGEEITALQREIITGRQDAPVDCHWLYRWADERKDLIRLDTEQTVRTEGITQEERQQHFRFEGDAALEKLEQTATLTDEELALASWQDLAGWARDGGSPPVVMDGALDAFNAIGGPDLVRSANESELNQLQKMFLLELSKIAAAQPPKPDSDDINAALRGIEESTEAPPPPPDGSGPEAAGSSPV